MWSPAVNVLAFSTSSLEAIRIDASGNVGIANTPSGTYKLEVTGALSASSMVLGAALPVASGGTGAATLTSGQLIVGAGTGAVTSSLIADSGTTVTVNGIFAVNGTTIITGAASGITMSIGTASFSLTPTAAGTITLGRTNGNGTITVGQSTATQTVQINAGVTASGSTSTTIIGANGAVGSTANITIGGGSSTSTITLTGSTVCTGTLRLKGYTVATLPTAGTAGRVAYVTDALAPAFLVAVAAGGAVVTPVFDNGTAWVAG